MTNFIEKEILKDVLNNPGDTFYENVLSDFLDEQCIEHDFRKPLHKEKVEELKPYQEKCLDVWVNHWISIGLCTNPTNENKTERYFFDFCKELGLEKPKNIIWINNPVEMCRQTNNCVNDLVLNQTWLQIMNQIKYQVWFQIKDQINDQTYYMLLNRAWSKIGHQIWLQVRDYVWNHVRNKICIEASGELNNRIKNQLFYGQHEANWFAYYSYMMQVLRMEAPKPSILLMLLAQETNWWFPAEQTVCVVRKPKECIVKNGKLVKLVYQDGYTIT
jgi:hypothetical protein